MRIIISLLTIVTLASPFVLATQDKAKASSGVEVLFFSKGHFYHSEAILKETEGAPDVVAGVDRGAFISFEKLIVTRFWQRQMERYRLPARQPRSSTTFQVANDGSEMNQRSAYRFHMVGDILYHGCFAIDRLSWSHMVAIRLGSLEAFSEKNWQFPKRLKMSVAEEMKGHNLWFPLGWEAKCWLSEFAQYFYDATGNDVAMSSWYNWKDSVPDIFVDFYPKDDNHTFLFVLYAPTLPKSVKGWFPTGKIEVFECGPNFAMKNNFVRTNTDKLVSGVLVKAYTELTLRETIETDMKEPFHVLVSGKDYCFVTTSGSLYRRKSGQTKTEALWSKKESAITTVICNIDSGKNFGFAEQKQGQNQERRKAVYFEFNNTANGIPCILEPITDMKIPISLQRVMPYSEVLVRDKKWEQD